MSTSSPAVPKPPPLPVFAALARGVLGDAYVPEVPQRMVETIGLLASDKDRKQAFATFAGLDTKAGALAFTGRPVPVSWLTPRQAENLVQRWKASRVPLRRQLGGLMVTLATNALYGHPSPEWERIGYQGPMGPPPDVPPHLHPIRLDEDEEITCDVVVVGSGAGAGCAAAHLADAGLQVVILEKGRYRAAHEYTHLESESMRDMYLYGASLATSDLGVRIIAGSTLGGGTVVNYTTSFETPEHVRRQWARISGIEAFVSGEYQESLDAMSVRLNVNRDSSAAGKRDALMEEGLKRLDWHVDQIPRSVKGCTQDEACGFCGFGCRVGAKHARTFLESAEARSARMIVEVDVRKVIVRDGRAEGVEGVTRDGRRVVVRARAVVVGAGAIETPALLLRSGLGGQVGRNLRLHPGTAAFGRFAEEVRWWEGTLQARYSDEFRGWDDGYGPIFETVPIHPGAGAGVMWWFSAKQHRDLMAQFRNMSLVAVLPRDSSAGRVRLNKDGSPRVDYKLNSDDQRRIAEGVVMAGKVLEAAGAEEIFSTHSVPASYRPAPGAHARWADETRALGYGKGRNISASYHQMGSCRMGLNPATSAIDAVGQTHEVRDLYVVDASTFPDASGVNPMLSIYGIANMIAPKIAARLG